MISCADAADLPQQKNQIQRPHQEKQLHDCRQTDIALCQVKQVASLFEVDIPVIDMDYQKNILYGAGVAGSIDTTIANNKRAFFELNSNIWKEKGSKAAYLGTGRHGGGIILRLMFVEVEGHWLNVTTGQRAPFSEEEFRF